eukprot:TRINITY_DN26758_c0_g1_i1.p1 TRINITY_DN26758_c0_g1~~TRINITY_DN26758_c0_g1_i1.p1  ORF type:complete len:621 (+),score=19.37 TRINITY_DN26758_c0_g1_i1:88-1950(+)
MASSLCMLLLLLFIVCSIHSHTAGEDSHHTCLSTTFVRCLFRFPQQLARRITSQFGLGSEHSCSQRQACLVRTVLSRCTPSHSARKACRLSCADIQTNVEAPVGQALGLSESLARKHSFGVTHSYSFRHCERHVSACFGDGLVRSISCLDVDCNRCSHTSGLACDLTAWRNACIDTPRLDMDREWSRVDHYCSYSEGQKSSIHGSLSVQLVSRQRHFTVDSLACGTNRQKTEALVQHWSDLPFHVQSTSVEGKLRQAQFHSRRFASWGCNSEVHCGRLYPSDSLRRPLGKRLIARSLHTRGYGFVGMGLFDSIGTRLRPLVTRFRRVCISASTSLAMAHVEQIISTAVNSEEVKATIERALSMDYKDRVLGDRMSAGEFELLALSKARPIRDPKEDSVRALAALLTAHNRLKNSLDAAGVPRHHMPPPIQYPPAPIPEARTSTQAANYAVAVPRRQRRDQPRQPTAAPDDDSLAEAAASAAEVTPSTLKRAGGVLLTLFMRSCYAGWTTLWPFLAYASAYVPYLIFVAPLLIVSALMCYCFVVPGGFVRCLHLFWVKIFQLLAFVGGSLVSSVSMHAAATLPPQNESAVDSTQDTSMPPNTLHVTLALLLTGAALFRATV